MNSKKYEQDKEAKLNSFIDEVAEEAADSIVTALFGERKACKQIRIEVEQHTALKMLSAQWGESLEQVTKKIIAKGLGR